MQKFKSQSPFLGILGIFLGFSTMAQPAPKFYDIRNKKELGTLYVYKKWNH